MESNIYIYIIFSCLRSEVLQFIRLIPDEVFLHRGCSFVILKEAKLFDPKGN